MYRHILIATDGSTLAEKAVDSGTKLAAALGAKLTVAHVGAPYAPPRTRFSSARPRMPKRSTSPAIPTSPSPTTPTRASSRSRSATSAI